MNKIAKAKFYLNTSLGLTSWLTCQQIPPKYAKKHKNAHSGPRGKSQTSFFCIFDLTIGFLDSINMNGDVPTMKLLLFDNKYCQINFTTPPPGLQYSSLFFFYLFDQCLSSSFPSFPDRFLATSTMAMQFLNQMIENR